MLPITSKPGVAGGMAVLMALLLSGITSAAELPDRPLNQQTAMVLFELLDQNVDKEATLYADYIVYYQDRRTDDFKAAVAQIKSEQQALIQTLMEIKRVSALQSGDAAYYAGLSLASGSGRFGAAFADLYRHWRGFYFWMSGGFFIVFSTLATCTTCYVEREEIFHAVSDRYGRVGRTPKIAA